MNEQKILNKMHELEEIIQYEFNNISYLIEAMRTIKIGNIDKSKNNKTYTNEKLAILGDAILQLILIEHYYLLDKKQDKQSLNDSKIKLVKDEYQYKIINKLGIHKFAFNENNLFFDELPENNKLPHSSNRPFYLEAIIGAIYLDSSIDQIREWIKKVFIDEVWKDEK